jgi:hypothetical protein
LLKQLPIFENFAGDFVSIENGVFFSSPDDMNDINTLNIPNLLKQRAPHDSLLMNFLGIEVYLLCKCFLFFFISKLLRQSFIEYIYFQDWKICPFYR